MSNRKTVEELNRLMQDNVGGIDVDLLRGVVGRCLERSEEDELQRMADAANREPLPPLPLPVPAPYSGDFNNAFWDGAQGKTPDGKPIFETFINSPDAEHFRVLELGTVGEFRFLGYGVNTDAPLNEGSTDLPQNES